MMQEQKWIKRQIIQVKNKRDQKRFYRKENKKNLSKPKIKEIEKNLLQ